jgi:phage-related tail protein
VPGSICGTDAIDRIKQNEAGLLQAVAAEAAGQKGVAVTTRSGRGSAASSAPLDEGQKRTELQRSVRELANAVELGQLALSRIESLEGPEERSAPAPALCNKAFMG